MTRLPRPEVGLLLPARAQINPWYPADVELPGPWTAIGANGQAMGGTRYYNNPAAGAEAAWRVPLRAGTYRLDYIGTRNPAYGIVTFKLNGTTIGTVDQYGSPQVNLQAALTGIQVVRGGMQELRIQGLTKHADSTGYYITYSSITLSRTGPLA